jgi:hypothetical protein
MDSGFFRANTLSLLLVRVFFTLLTIFKTCGFSSEHDGMQKKQLNRNVYHPSEKRRKPYGIELRAAQTG